MGTFYVNRIPCDIVDNVVQVAEVYQMKLVHSQSSNKKNVILVSPLGKTAAITREMLINNFLTLEGKPIKILTLRYDKKYTVMRMNKTDCMAVRIPKASKSEFIRADGSSISHGKVLVIPASKIDGTSGTVDMTEAAEVEERLFKKIYSVTKFSTALCERLQIARESNDRTDEILQSGGSADTDWSDEWNDDSNSQNKTISSDNKRVNISNTSTNKSDNRVKAVAAVVDIGGKTIGYRLRAANGKEAAYSLVEIAQFAAEGKISNVKLVHGESGDYLAGVGCRLKELPVEQI